MVGATKTYPDVQPAISESLERVRAKAPPPPGPDPVPNYLSCVYREAMSWLSGSTMLQACAQNYYEKHFHQRVQKNYFRFLIELSAGSHVSLQEKSKYVKVLKFARASGIKPQEFKKFLRKHGGIKACIKASNAAGMENTAAPRKRVSK